MTRPSPAKPALFWIGLACAAASYAWTTRPAADDPSWTPDGTGLCWHWRADDGSIAQCCRLRTGVWWDAERHLCDGARPGHGAPEPTR